MTDISEQIRGARGAGYQVIYADPPWKFRANSGGVGDGKMGRNAGFHYELMSLQQIRDLEVKQMIAPKAIGFTWVKLRKKSPGLFLDPNLDLHVGLGLTTRKNAEFCLIGSRGRSLRQSAKVHEVGLFPLMEHSRKPDQFRKRIEEYVGPGLRMAELFAREAPAGWDAFGNEVGKFK